MQSVNFIVLLFVLGRILYGGYFVMNGLNHYMKTGMLADYARSKNVPAPRLVVLASGALLLAGGVGILVGAYIPWAVAALVIFLVPVTVTMHAYWRESDPAMRMADMVNFTKNMALMGAALMLLAIPSPWEYGVQ